MVQFIEKYMFSFGHVTFALAEGNHEGGMLNRELNICSCSLGVRNKLEINVGVISSEMVVETKGEWIE